MLLSDKFICATQELSTQENPQPAPWFKKEIEIKDDIASAEIAVCGLGFYELYLNGDKITKGRLCPYITNSDDVVFYDSYDITDLLINGDNAFKFLLGNGMQDCFSGDIWEFEKAEFRSSPKLAFIIEITYSNGNKETIEADESVLTKPSNIISNDLRLGEIYDARISNTEWKNALWATSPKGEKMLSIAKPIAKRAELKPVKVWQEDNAYIYDFGVNSSGVCRLNVSGKDGQKITLTFGEILSRGKFYIDNTTFEHCKSRYFQRDVYICKDGENIWEPRFTYHGFRYVKVEGISEEQAKCDLLTFVVFNTDLASKGSFECDNEVINALHKMSLNSTLSNFHHFPTDCPHREKNGWTADAALSSAHTLLYLEPSDNYKQWLIEICKAQNDKGALPGIVPTGGWGFEWGNGPAWDSVIVELPYQLWQKRNDISAFEYASSNILKYIKYLKTRLDDNGLLAIGLGDWCAPHSPTKAPLLLTDSIEAYDIATKSAQMFERINDKKSADYCLTFANSIRKNIRKHLFDTNTCTFAGNCQTSQAMGIYYKIIDESEKEKAFSVLLDKIIESDYHIDTGVLGGRVIFHTLAENGEIDTAIKMLTNPTAPSYAQWVNDGDTTLCEGFYEYDGLSSHNHHFWGNISAFFMEQICGIKPMADKIIIDPHFPSDMSFARAEFDSVFGKIKAEWERLDGKISFNIDCDDSVKDKLVSERFK